MRFFSPSILYIEDVFSDVSTNSLPKRAAFELHAICKTRTMNSLAESIETVCIIDDDKIHHFTVEKTIQLQGLTKQLLSFHDGQEAIAFLSRNINNDDLLPDLIFLDLNMPVVNGWQFLQQFALLKPQIKKKIRIYVVSSSVNEIEIRRAKAVNEVSGYLEKPVKPEQIKQVFERSLD